MKSIRCVSFVSGVGGYIQNHVNMSLMLCIDSIMNFVGWNSRWKTIKQFEHANEQRENVVSFDYDTQLIHFEYCGSNCILLNLMRNGHLDGKNDICTTNKRQLDVFCFCFWGKVNQISRLRFIGSKKYHLKGTFWLNILTKVRNIETKSRVPFLNVIQFNEFSWVNQWVQIQNQTN